MKTTDAVKSTEQAATVKKLLTMNAKGNELYADIWTFGIQVALRISDLLSITFEDCQGDRLTITESKTGKVRQIALTATAKAVIARRRAANPTHTFLFEVSSNRAKGKAVSRVAVAVAFKAVGDEMKITLGTHSMRKTLGWAMYNGGLKVEEVCKVLGHSNPATTMLYLGITQSEIDASYHAFEIAI
jgi:integrase